jgi:hypothetical protein
LDVIVAAYKLSLRDDPELLAKLSSDFGRHLRYMHKLYGYKERFSEQPISITARISLMQAVAQSCTVMHSPARCFRLTALTGQNYTEFKQNVRSYGHSYRSTPRPLPRRDSLRVLRADSKLSSTVGNNVKLSSVPSVLCYNSQAPTRTSLEKHDANLYALFPRR